MLFIIINIHRVSFYDEKCFAIQKKKSGFLLEKIQIQIKTLHIIYIFVGRGRDTSHLLQSVRRTDYGEEAPASI